MIKNLIAILITNFVLLANENDSLFWFDINDIVDESPYFPLIINKVFSF